MLFFLGELYSGLDNLLAIGYLLLNIDYLILFALLLLQAGRFQTAALAGDSPWCAASEQNAVPDAECEALEAFYHSTNGSGWRNNSGWLDSTAVCEEWAGVTCSAGHVSSLTLDSNKLSGQLPPSLGDLSSLNTLDLSANQIGGAIPPQLGRLASLNDLALGANLLQGRIPAQLGQLGALVTLDLGDNRLEGSIPPELGALQNLSGLLYLDGNQLEGPIPPAVCQLNPLLAGIDYNKLDVFGSGESCDTLFPGWRTTQTAAPAAVSVSSLGVTTAAGTTAVSGEVLLQWVPASYSGGGGGFEVLTRRRVDGQIESRGRTKDKTAGSLHVTIDGDPRAYTYFVRAHTAAHASNQSALTSVDGDEVEITAVGERRLDISPNLPILYIPALAPLALLFITGIAILLFKNK